MPVEGSEFEFETDMVVYAIGTSANPILGQTSQAPRSTRWGYIETDENLATSMAGVYAGGDIVTGCGHRDPGHGCGPQGGAQHQGLSRHPRQRDGLSDRKRLGLEGALFGIDLAERNFARVPRMMTREIGAADHEQIR